MNKKWFFFSVWLICSTLFLVGQSKAPDNYHLLPGNPWGKLFGATVILGSLSFVLMSVFIGLDTSGASRSKKDFSNTDKKHRTKTNKPGLSFGYVIFMLFIAVLLSIVFGLVSLPFLQAADNLTFAEKANIGGQNMRRIMEIYALLALITTVITLLSKTWRLLGVILIIFTITGISVVSVIDNHNNGSVYLDDNPVITDKTKCIEDFSLNQAKMCTVIIVRDDGGHGTGFSINKGYLITNKHVVDGAKKLTTWIDGEINLSMWNYSPTLDVAILKLPVEIPTCKWFDSSQLALAETLYAVGWPNEPFGDSTITKGIYSRLNQFEGGLEFVQTDAAINPGSSGGPLINSCGVVGINTVKEFWTQEQLPRPLEGLGNALSSKTLIPLVSELVAQGYDSEIPNTAVTVNASNYEIPNSAPTINIDEVKSHLAHIRDLKESWGSKNEVFPQDEIRTLLDSFERQIIFCETIISRVEATGRVTQDDLIMYDQIVKMSHETSALATKLRSWYFSQ